jgi:cellulose biosynthesis protein BcsQ
MSTKFVTFYSTVGGTGRSMALVNMAYELARKGKRVVIIDGDLYSPSFWKFPTFHHLKADWKKHKSGGLFELFKARLQYKTTPSASYHYSVKVNDNLHIIPAGLENNQYYKDIHTFNWEADWEEEGRYFWGEFRDYICFEFDNPDYILIDLTSGFHLLSSICLMLLSDLALIFTTLSNRSIETTNEVLKSIDISNKTRFEEIKLEPIDTKIIVSPFPDNCEIDKGGERWSYAKALFNRSIDCYLPYTAILALGERVLLNDSYIRDDTAIIQQYKKLCKIIED